MKIVSLNVENVKRIKAVHVTPTGDVVVVGGKNGAGKSSLLDSIAMILGGGKEIPACPIRAGEDTAEITVDLGEYSLRRWWTKSGATSLEVKAANGSKVSSPQALLDGLTSKVTFDPLSFLGEEPVKQLATLKRLVGLDFSALDAKKKIAYDKRTVAGRELESLRAQCKAAVHFPEAPKAEQSASSIGEKIAEASKHNATKAALDAAAGEAKRYAEGAVRRRNEMAESIVQMEAKLSELRGVLSSMDKFDIPDTKAALAKTEAAVADFSLIDVSALQAELAGIEEANKKVRANAAREDLIANGKAKADEHSKLEAEVKACESERQALLESAKFPVAGLGFGEGGVTLNGLPFEQASAAERLRVSVAMAAALNPKIKAMLVRDGSLLDDDSLALLAELAKEHGLQVWLERVGEGAECSVIIEDGSVKA